MSVVTNALEALMPPPWARVAAVGALLLWVGWNANAVADSVEKHYRQMDTLLLINASTCKATHRMAKMDESICEVK